MPRDLFLRPVSCRNGGENEKTLGVLISDVLIRHLTTPPVCDLVQNEANLLVGRSRYAAEKNIKSVYNLP